MWLFTETGFVSAIRWEGEPDKITVRSRDKKSLESLISWTNAELLSLRNTDYPYRVLVTNEEFAGWVAEQALDISYPNFKNQVKKTRGSKFASLLSQVWGVMLEAERIEHEEETGQSVSSYKYFGDDYRDGYYE
jgi:hypothetical protein